MKICKNPNCPKKGQPQPLENFGKDSRNKKDGLLKRCKICINKMNRSNYNSEKYAKKYSENKELFKERNKQNWKRNGKNYKERRRETNAQWYLNSDKLEKNKKHQKENPDIGARNTAKYRAKKKQATPKWANETAIEAFYFRANWLTEITGIEYEVDHIIPLQSNLVCGLHVENNLQIITKKQNTKKSNKFKPINGKQIKEKQNQYFN